MKIQEYQTVFGTQKNNKRETNSIRHEACENTRVIKSRQNKRDTHRI